MTERAVQDTAFEEMLVGKTCAQSYTITPAVYHHFVSGFHDTNPLHVDDAFARKNGFEAKVMHGAILNGFISQFVGVHFPGRRALLHSVAIEYRAPSYLADQILVEGRVAERVESLRVIILSLALRNLSQGKLAAKARVQVGFTS